MSDKETTKKKDDVQENANEQKKVMTKYDRKVQRRQEQKEREMKEKQVSRMISVAIVLALVALVASFPIRKYVATHQAYITVGGEKITRAEFDYNFYIAYNNYISQYGSYLSYFGLDTTKDLADQMYSETMTWKDYFDEMTVDSLKSAKALKAEADAAGFTYDATEEIKTFKESVKKSADSAGTTVKKYLQGLYGSYATLSNISSYMASTLREGAYYQQVSDGKAATDAEIQTYYEEHKNDYDSVDFYQTLIEADLPTEPTELADVEDEEDEEEYDEEDEDAEYEPSDAEVEKAMEDAKKLADAADPKAGELQENQKESDLSYLISDWLFDDERKEGDTTVIEDESENQYYVLSFVKRYLDNSATADLRLIVTQDTDGQFILDEWAAGAATEESFKELYRKYNANAANSSNDGLIEGVTPDGLEDGLADWIFAEGRAAGDTTAMTMESGYNYVLYYVGEGRPAWKNSIKNTLLSEAMSDYMEEISSKIPIEDKKGRLNYLKVKEAEANAEPEAATDPEADDNIDEDYEVDYDDVIELDDLEEE